MILVGLVESVSLLLETFNATHEALSIDRLSGFLLNIVRLLPAAIGKVYFVLSNGHMIGIGSDKNYLELQLLSLQKA